MSESTQDTCIIREQQSYALWKIMFLERGAAGLPRGIEQFVKFGVPESKSVQNPPDGPKNLYKLNFLQE